MVCSIYKLPGSGTLQGWHDKACVWRHTVLDRRADRKCSFKHHFRWPAEKSGLGGGLLQGSPELLCSHTDVGRKKCHDLNSFYIWIFWDIWTSTKSSNRAKQFLTTNEKNEFMYTALHFELFGSPQSIHYHMTTQANLELSHDFM